MNKKMNKKQKNETIKMFENLFDIYDPENVLDCLRNVPEIKNFIFLLMDDAEKIGYNIGYNSGVNFGIEYAQTQMEEPEHDQLH